MEVTLEMGPDFQRTVSELSSMGASILKAASHGLDKGSKLAAGVVIREYLSGQALKRRSGMLAKHVEGWLEKPLDAVVGIKPGSPVDAYAWMLGDERMTIKPKKAKFLSIPIGENLTSAGVPRYTSPRQVEGGFFIRTDAGDLLFGYKKGKKGKFRPLFLLVKSVDVLGSSALPDGVMDSIDDVANEIQKEITEATKD